MAVTNDQLSLFNGQLYEQTDGLAIGSPLGPLVANVFMCSIEEILEREGKMPAYYGRYVDDTLTIMHDKTSADSFPEFLNHCHASVKFTTEIENNGMLPFLGTWLSNKSTHIETKVYVKFTNTGLLLHYKSHVDEPYKRGLLKTTLDRAFRLYFLLTDPISRRNACDRLKLLFSRLKYPKKLINSTTTRFIAFKVSDQLASPADTNESAPVRIVLPFQEQGSADNLRNQLKDRSQKIHIPVQLVFVSHKNERDLKPREFKPPVVNKQCLVFKFKCDLCDAGYVGFTGRHLHQRFVEHEGSSLSIGKHSRDEHFLFP